MAESSRNICIRFSEEEYLRLDMARAQQGEKWQTIGYRLWTDWLDTTTRSDVADGNDPLAGLSKRKRELASVMLDMLASDSDDELLKRAAEATERALRLWDSIRRERAGE